MVYRVSLSGPAENDAYAAFERIRESAPMHAEKWLVGLFMKVSGLAARYEVKARSLVC